jgi:non-specific serine/threonine protein kinase
VCFVDLSGTSDPELVPAAISQALRLPQPPEGTSAQIIAKQLVKRELLLIVDNCEHLVDACALLAEALANGCPRSRVMATSREPLSVNGETVVAIEGLELPGPANLGNMDWGAALLE